MLKCPHCNKQVTHKLLDNWFECPSCGNWLRRRRNQDGSQWLESGLDPAGNIQPVPPSRRPSPIQLQQPKEPDFTPSIDWAKLGELAPDTAKQRERRLSSLNSASYEGALERQSETPQSTSASSGCVLPFGCGTILVGVAIYVFSRLIGLEFNLSAYVTLALVALVSGVITIGIVLISK